MKNFIQCTLLGVVIALLAIISSKLTDINHKLSREYQKEYRTSAEIRENIRRIYEDTEQMKRRFSNEH